MKPSLQSHMKRSLFISTLFIVLVFSFNNCGGSFGAPSLEGQGFSQSLGSLAAGTCEFNSQAVQDGASVTAFLVSTVSSGGSCQSEVRTCRGGVMSGSFSYTSCGTNVPATCLFGTNTNIMPGASFTAYQTSSVPIGQVCTSQTRSCLNGALSGSFGFASCTPGGPASCPFNGGTIPSGGKVIGFQAANVNAGQSCLPETRVCTDGQLSGSFANGTCVVNQPDACTFGDRNIPSGASLLTYQSATVPYGHSCLTENRICTNGSLSGSYAFSTCVVSPPPSVPPGTISEVRILNWKATLPALANPCPAGWTPSVTATNNQSYDICLKRYSAGDTSIISGLTVITNGESCPSSYTNAGGVIWRWPVGPPTSDAWVPWMTNTLCLKHESFDVAAKFITEFYAPTDPGRSSCGGFPFCFSWIDRTQ